MNNDISPLHKVPENGKLKVAAYARVSKDKTDLENSLENQMRYYTTIICEHSDWELAGIYADDGITGSSIKKRNQFQLMLNKAFAHEIDVIVVKSISRFARNIINLLETIQELRDENVEVYFEKENISTFDTKSDNYLTIYGKFAEEELVSMSRNVVWGNEKRLQAGKWYINASRLFGYMFNDNREVVINEKEAQWVRVVFQMYSEGFNTASIADHLERNGVTTIKGNPRWEPGTIRRMLRNEKYCGDILMQKTYSDGPITQRRVKNRGEKDMYLFEDAIPAIVPKHLWKRVQQLMDENKERYKVGNKITQNLTTSFTGFGFCPHCRNSYFRKFNRGVEMLYCSSNKSRCLCKESESVFIDDLKKIIPLLVKKLKANENEFKKALITAFSTTVCSEYEDEDTMAIDSQINELREQLRKYSSYDGDEFDSLKSQIKKTIASLSDKKVLIENERLINLSPESRALSIIKELRKFPDDEDLGDYNFRNLFKNVIVINRDRLIFIVGSSDLTKIPMNINKVPMTFIETYDHRIRSTTYTCQFGIYINK